MKPNRCTETSISFLNRLVTLNLVNTQTEILPQCIRLETCQDRTTEINNTETEEGMQIEVGIMTLLVKGTNSSHSIPKAQA